MKAQRLIAPYQFELVDLPVPEPGDNEVVLKNMYLSVCTSDMQIYHGKHAYAAMPVIMGHEVSGVVVKTGKAVHDWKVGDRVVVQPQLYCGKCYPCRTGHFNVCEDLKVTGVHVDGFACEYTAVSADCLHRLPDDISFRDGALIEPMSVGFGVVRRICEVTELAGKKVCVVGAGPIGNFIAQACKAMGADKVMMTDIVQDKLDLAIKCGVDDAVNTKERSLADAVQQCFGADKADIIIDSAATPFVFQSILDAARKASIIVLSGNYKEPVQLDVTQIQRREITVLGHMMYIDHEFDEALEQLAAGRICTDGIVTQEWTLPEYPDAFRYADEHAGEVMKMLVRIAGDDEG